MVKSARKLIGATNPLESEPGTIRGDFAVQVRLAVVGCAVVWCAVVWCGVVCMAYRDVLGVLRQRLDAGMTSWSSGRITTACCVMHQLMPLLACVCPPTFCTVQVGRNVVHGSDSIENGERETGAPCPMLRTACCVPPAGALCSVARPGGPGTTSARCCAGGSPYLALCVSLIACHTSCHFH